MRVNAAWTSDETGIVSLTSWGGEVLVFIAPLCTNYLGFVYQDADRTIATLRNFRDASQWPARALLYQPTTRAE